MSYGYYPLYVGSGVSARATPATVATTTTISTPTVSTLEYPTPATVVTTTTIGTPTLTKGTSVAPVRVATTVAIGLPSVRTSVTRTASIVVTRATIGTPLTLTTSATVFRGPSRRRSLGKTEKNGLLRRMYWDEGRTVLKQGGFYRTVDNPSVSDIADADEVYLGGRTYTVSLDEARALYAAGYSAYLFSE